MDENKLQQILETVKIARSDPSANAVDHYLSHMHLLAEAQYYPAIEFFVSTLDDTRWDWRVDSLTALGFHYDLRSQKELLNKISHMLLTDPDDSVRMTAASVLGNQSGSPNEALIQSLQTDNDSFVREVAFCAILKLLGVPFPTQTNLMERVKAGEIPATLKGLQQTLVDLGINVTLSVDDE